LSAWQEAADGVLVRRYQPLDVNICVVRGRDGLLVVDTRSSPVEAAQIEADLRQLGAGPVRCVVNTHAHFDHTFGNQHFGPGSSLDVPIYGHHLVPAHLDEYERPRLAAWHDGTGGEPARDWGGMAITPPTHLVQSPQSLDLGGRDVELLPLGRGHTDNDLVIHVPDVRTWIVGDVVEESGPPMYGSGCFPLEWPATLARLLEEIDPSDVVVPGHGLPVSRDFVADQLADLARVAARARQLYDAGATVEEALNDNGGWPFPAEGLELAVARAFADLGIQTRPTP